MTYTDFLKNAIIETVEKTADKKLLQYMYTVLMSASSVETPQADS